MKKGWPNPYETGQEHIPTAEEVHSVLKILAKKEYQETKKYEDEKGLYFLEIQVPGDMEGQMAEYNYMRKGRYKEGESTTTEIHVTYYENGSPTGGTSAARYIDGEWKIL